MPSLGKVFGGWKFLLKWLFLLGQARGKILTLDNLRRNIYIVNRCCMCKNSWESVGHLLLCCSYAYNLWRFVFSLFGVSWVMLKQVVDLLACWNRGVGGRCWAAVIRELSMARNIPSLNWNGFSYLLFDWMSAMSSPYIPSFWEFLDLCSFT